MQFLPQELFDAILGHLAVYDFPVSARFPVLDNDSRQAVLQGRLAHRCFRNSRALTDLFVVVLEETPFLWHDDQMSRLLEVSRSQYAGRMTTLSLSSVSFRPWHRHLAVTKADQNAQFDRPVTVPMPKNLSTVLRRFACVRHFRYYPISPKCLREACPGYSSDFSTGPMAQYGYPPDNDNIHWWLMCQQESTPILSQTLAGIADAELSLDSVTFPLFGNRAAYCGVQVAGPCFPTSLKRLSISIRDGFDDDALFGPWLTTLKNLVFLEVATSRDPESLGPWNPFASCRRLTDPDAPNAGDQLPRLEELRLMSDNQICFSEHDLFSSLEVFPNLRGLGLAHILIKSQTVNATSWSSFVKRLIPKALERLWLIDPRDLWTNAFMGEAGHYVLSKYWGDDSFRAAAHTVRLIDTRSLWVADKGPPKRRDFDYPGFAIFEQIGVAQF